MFIGIMEHTGNPMRLIDQVITETLIYYMDPIVDDVVPLQHNIAVLVCPTSAANFANVHCDVPCFQAIEILVEFNVEGH